MPEDLKHPLNSGHARKLISEILARGTVEYWKHARDELKRDSLETTDAENVLRCGKIYEPAEQSSKDSTWRYRVHTDLMVVVVIIYSSEELAVVTAWRKR
ncbi:MAG: DUF4258 domain-containing protein [Myxococcales bacterium]|nr:DUF4258 domain-containing protein [Myxococcales bacterium]